MKIISGEELFVRWDRLNTFMKRFVGFASSIIQNDMNITNEEFVEWKKDFRREKRIFHNLLDSVYRDTLRHINKLNRKE